jgi:dolichol-phosphate mannosyltransferase
MTSVTVVIPAYNEGEAFGAALVSLADYFSLHKNGGYEFSYLIVDDGSSDETYAAAASFARWRKDVKVLRHEKNRGLGAALRTAFREVDTQIAVVLDADMSYTAATAMELIEVLERDHVSITLASPYMSGGDVRNVPLMRKVLSREANRVLSLATSGKLATLTCMVRAYRADALRLLEFRSNGMEAIPEMLLSAVRQRMRVTEVPATLQWSPARRMDSGRLRVSSLASRIGAIFLMACRHRPSLWFAVPGLAPGLLPLVVAILFILRVNAATLAIGTTITIVVQYTSLALFSGQIAAFFGRRLSLRNRHTNGVTNGYDIPGRTL